MPRESLKNVTAFLLDPKTLYYRDLPMNLRFVKLSHHCYTISINRTLQWEDEITHLGRRIAICIHTR